jgi:phospho-N-acetylmuramoyl-pentapeptide-transferase
MTIELSIIKILLPALMAFCYGILISPLLTHYLYKYRVWKKTGGKVALMGNDATEFNRLKGENETKTPRMGGILIWMSVFMTVCTLMLIKLFFPEALLAQFDFFSREQTWIPLCVLLIGALFGLLNDFYDVAHDGKGIRLLWRILLISILSGAIGYWFYAKLEVVHISLPFMEPLFVGVLLIPFFVLMTNALYASGVIDGIDGLSGGVLASAFSAYAGVAIIQSQMDIAALCATIAGAIVAFTWFNIPPARFWMTETGSMALTLTLSVVVLMTDSLGSGHGIFLFLIIGLPLIATVSSNVLQIIWRKVFGKKLFRIAPLHHHFEAIGWPSPKVTMRYWIISIMCAIIGIIVATII